MADQQRLTQAKNSFADAKKEYFEQKEKALEEYNKQKEHGLVSDDESFARWRAVNFNQVRQQIESTSAQVQQAARQLAEGGDIWTVIEKKEYLLISEDVPHGEHLEGLLLWDPAPIIIGREDRVSAVL